MVAEPSFELSMFDHGIQNLVFKQYFGHPKVGAT